VHVALLSHEYPPFIYGGVGTFVENLAHGLLKRGVEVTVIAGYPVPRGGFKKFKTGEDQANSEINIIRFPYPNFSPRQLWFQIFNLPKISEVVRRINADVIHGQSGVAYPALIELKNAASTVVSYHNNPKMELTLSLYSMSRGGSVGDIFKYVVGYPEEMNCFKKEFALSDAPIAVSESLMSGLLLDMGQRDSKKMRYIHNGVNVEEIENEYVAIDAEKEKNKPEIFFGGRFYWRKGVLNLIQLAILLEKKYHSNYRIVVHGSGPLRGKMEMLIQKHNLTNIILKGFSARHEFLKDMKRASYVVIPSLFEACPMLLLESMCLGKIPVMYDLPYSQELTQQGKYGILSSNTAEMAEKILSFSKQNDVEAFEDKIRSFATKQYNVSKTAAQYYELYKSIC
jgi:glycogen synthase